MAMDAGDILNSAVFIFCVWFTNHKRKQTGCNLGAFSAFIIAPYRDVPSYISSGKYPGVFSFLTKMVLHTLLWVSGDPHFDPLHILSNVLIVFGFYAGLGVECSATRSANHGLKRQLAGMRAADILNTLRSILIMFGFLLQWPTLPTWSCFQYWQWFMCGWLGVNTRAAIEHWRAPIVAMGSYTWMDSENLRLKTNST